MAKCEKCGNKYSFWSAKSSSSKIHKSLCDTCFEQFLNSDLKSIVSDIIPDKEFSILGVAYWNKLSTVIGTVFAKLFFGYLLGFLGFSASGKEHRAGVLAIYENDLIVIDFGLVVGEDLTLEELKSIIQSPSIKKASFNSIIANCDGNKLTIKGDINIKATFPISYDKDNPSKASQIYNTIQGA